ncbi:ABC transporter CDR4 [Madurella mycetomatis]|uniref:ABC transporter CDR4 n=1 Tax=Madurella mycetomatis TaxID=100816 RepID=A0A175VR12_9PEZI|nr:ABC transporter CDR4 [Madurella mycetomatis]KXX73695.1 ABC transporter CDR4 [Madurella mycetomatis]
MNTLMGDDMIRGVSGGEKKRASIAEAFAADARIQAWDNTTRGLDSLTAFRVARTLKRTAVARRAAVLVSVSTSARRKAVEYFARLGFERSSRVTTADFLTSLTYSRERVVRPGFENRVPRSAEDFAAAWIRSPEREHLLRQVDEYNAVHPVQREQDALVRLHRAMAFSRGSSRATISAYALSTEGQVAECVRRAICRIKNNPVPMISGVIGSTAIAVIIASIYYNLPQTTDTFYKRDVLIFYSIVLTASSSVLEFYRPFVESTASMICDLPHKIFVTIGFTLSIYFMTNLWRTPAAYFTFYLISFACQLTMSMFFRMVGSLSKTHAVCMPPVANLMLLFIIYAGFVIPPEYTYRWLGWLRWINPIGYAYESLMVNEYWGRDYACTTLVPAGPGYSASEQICATVGSVPGESYVSGENYLRVKYSYNRAHLWRNFGVLLAIMVFFCGVHLLAIQYIKARRSKGDVLLFRRRDVLRAARTNPSQSRADIESAEGKEPGTAIQIVKTSPTVSMEAKAEEADRFHESKTTLLDGLVKQTAIFHWEDLSYDVKVKDGTKRILDGVDGWVRPGTLTALMRKTGYIQQADLHLPTATVREALTFSALLRQPRSVPRAEKIAYVEHVMAALDMQAYAGAIVGVPGEGLNVEQRKRLTIRIELAAKPELLLFLDEPTSGLDSQTVWSICTLLRKLADNGQAILCTIHQPSSQLFQMFDQLLLLGDGGRTLYFDEIGHSSKTVIDYFEQNSTRPCGCDENPAEWILDVTGAYRVSDAEAEAVDWHATWRDSPERQAIKHQLSATRSSLRQHHHQHQHHHHPQQTSPPPPNPNLLNQSQTQFAAPITHQLLLLAVSAGIGFFNGFSFYQTRLDIQGLTSILFSVFILTSVFSNIDQQVIPRFIAGRQLFEVRERHSKTYSWLVFVAAEAVVEMAWQAYYPARLWRYEDVTWGAASRGGLVFGALWAFCLFVSTASHTAAAAIEHAEVAVNVAQLVSSIWLVFCGVLVPPAELVRFWEFIYRLAPYTYFVGTMTAAGMGHQTVECSAIELLRFDPPEGLSYGRYMAQYLGSGALGNLLNPEATADCTYCPLHQTDSFLATIGIDVEQHWRNFGLLFVYIAFNILATFGLYWLARVPKRG